MDRTKSSSVTDSPINVPFSWENSPGVSKVGRQVSYSTWQRLPLPPVAAKCAAPASPVLAEEGMQVQMCSLHVVLKSPFNYKGTVADRKPGDPFLAAYVKCTASPLNPKGAAVDGGGKVCRRKSMFRLSCKRSCGVVVDSLVRTNKTGNERSC